ncbi:helix-turn-helix domain-containing protein [Tepidibacillus fermentans]|uniref:DNA-binding XRE family transcriptional regulator n=1 Tax=Tepidibacillus fermentans TaxID=1281767 RepID=A0A4R3KGV5_9BACI|nr:helix-turn-helix transcriptional regulator [Tepidibacillus fermentans]TCS82480.1 DNA-binding XRE family transcriptional regulator [Tepidibacillus fermentans]
MEKNVEIDNKAIGQRIRVEREKLGLSRGEFAEIIELSDYYVGQLERGERQMSLPVLVKIASCLHVSLDYLIWGKNTYDAYYIRDAYNMYDAFDSNKDAELNELINKCSPKELELVKKLIKTVLPYVGKN